ncbi:pectate lyase [Clostridium felsineum]|uniref:pectate lyase n=1 Tax=Clostridium felsineum TaxID=36839 RepID=UPI00098C4121|nr:pectate lyase [Clostridium felsineum]URZ04468.1 hypothetical protein CLAUR_045570 [Clostridium felsineum]
MLKSKLKGISSALAITLALTALMITAKPSSTVFAKGPASGTTASIADILKNQQADGGWQKYYGETSGDWAKSCIDNEATYTEIRRLAKEYTKTKNVVYSNAATRGINFLLNMQYQTNGGWPQVYNASGYHRHITYNDDAMINVMYLLDDVSNKKGDFTFIDNAIAAKCKTAVNKGIDCVLKTQVVENGKLTAWGQQHDEVTLKPAGARAYELPSLTASESTNIVKFLETRPSTPQIAASINGAKNWFKASEINGIRVVKANGDVKVVNDPKAGPIWARFYELGTNKPIFVGRNGNVEYKLSDIEIERRTGYAWYGSWPSSIIK